MEPGIWPCLTQQLKGRRAQYLPLRVTEANCISAPKSSICYFPGLKTQNWLLEMYEQWQRNKSNTKSACKMKLFSSHRIKKYLYMWKSLSKQHQYQAHVWPVVKGSKVTWFDKPTPHHSPPVHSFSQKTECICLQLKKKHPNLQIPFPIPPPNSVSRFLQHRR